jgi:hypothetical protein
MRKGFEGYGTRVATVGGRSLRQVFLCVSWPRGTCQPALLRCPSARPGLAGEVLRPAPLAESLDQQFDEAGHPWDASAVAMVENVNGRGFGTRAGRIETRAPAERSSANSTFGCMMMPKLPASLSVRGARLRNVDCCVDVAGARSRTGPDCWRGAHAPRRARLATQLSGVPSGTCRSGTASTTDPSAHSKPVVRTSDLNPATRLAPSPVAQITCRPTNSVGG